MITTLALYHLRFVLDTNTGKLATWRDNQPHTPNAETVRNARIAIAKANTAYGYAHGIQANLPAPATPSQIDDQALAFAHAYAHLIYRARGTTWLAVADAYATWTATGQLDQIGPDYRRRHTHPTAYTVAQITETDAWPEGTRFIPVGPAVPHTPDDSADGSPDNASGDAVQVPA